jgi:uncharacterized protein (DUF1499 family)
MVVIFTFLSACAGDRPKSVGLKNGSLAACPSKPNCVCSQSDDQRHLIQPFSFNDDADVAFARLKQIISNIDTTSIVAENRDYLMVEFRTRLGFVDDGEFLLDRVRNVIHIRSAARLGYYDLGKNRRRLEEIRQLFSLTRSKQ